MDALPENISYSPIYVPGLKAPLLRRDLFDARFQLYQRDEVGATSDKDDQGRRGEDGRDDTQQTHDRPSADGEEYVDSSTDLVPGLYEGGLKTWEGGVDLVEVLNGVEGVGSWLEGSRVLEVSIVASSSFPSTSPRPTILVPRSS